MKKNMEKVKDLQNYNRLNNEYQATLMKKKYAVLLIVDSNKN